MKSWAEHSIALAKKDRNSFVLRRALHTLNVRKGEATRTEEHECRNRPVSLLGSSRTIRHPGLPVPSERMGHGRWKLRTQHPLAMPRVSLGFGLVFLPCFIASSNLLGCAAPIHPQSISRLFGYQTGLFFLLSFPEFSRRCREGVR